MVNLINNKKKHGGARRGAGEKRSLEGGRAVPVYLDESSIEIGKDIGEGNLSGGVRVSFLVVSLLADPERERLLKRARAIEAENKERIREAQKGKGES